MPMRNICHHRADDDTYLIHSPKNKTMGKFVISKRKNNEFQFTLHADNGHVILTSEGYTAKSNCENGIDSVRKNSLIEGHYDKKMSSNAKHYFNLKAANGLIIGTSEMYESMSACENGIESV